VYPGDEVTTIFALERSTGNWSDTWSLTPGGIERGAGAVPFGGGVIFDHSVDREFLFSASVFDIWYFLGKRHLHFVSAPNDQAFNLV
jgi:hypothetical protein